MGVAALALTLLAALFVLRTASPQLAPQIRKHLIATLSERFASPVSLDTLRVQHDGGLLVQGTGLRIQSVLHGVAGDPAHPMLRVTSFQFCVGLLSLFRSAPKLHDVQVRGVLLQLPKLEAQGHAGDPEKGISLDSATLDDAHVIFESNDPKRAPLTFDFPHGVFRDIRPNKPLHYDLTVDNGVPIGLTQTSGTLGPWNFEDPRQTPVTGQFSFENKDVSSVRGLRGRLTLHGTYGGTVSQIHAQGTTDDPVFGLDLSSRTMALHTRFDLTMNAAAGILHLQQIDAQFLHTRFVCDGDITRSRTADGYNFDMHLQVPDGRVEDALALGSRTTPPILRGDLSLEGSVRMQAGPESVSHRLRFSPSRFLVKDAVFSSAQVQRQVNEMSERAQGHPQDANAQHASGAPFQAEGNFTLAGVVLHFEQVSMSMPGAQAVMSGQYMLEGTNFQLDGTVHTQAEASHMTTGLKSVLARPFNGLFSHGNRGATMPLRISGSGHEAKFEVELPGGKHMKAPAEN